MDMKNSNINGQEDVKPEEQSTYNVLIFALSTFNKWQMEGKGTDYLYTDKNGATKTIHGYYSLEPIPHYLIKHGCELDDPIECINEFIMLCSPETCERRDGNDKWQKKYLYDNQTPFEYMEKKIKEWIKESKKTEVGKWSSIDVDNDVRIQKFDLDVDNLKDVIDKTVDYLRELQKEGKKVRIIMDCHGGFRGVQLLVEAIITLLGIEGFHVSSKDSWTIYFDNVNDIDNTKNFIQQDKEAFEIFDFVSGINEFVNYGRSDSLERFVKNKNDPLLNNLKRIAEGIQMCLIQEFETGLDNLTDYFDPTLCKEHTKDPYLSLFEDMIKDNFGKLLEMSRTVEDEIQWCLDKGFYQQALTIIEAKGPRSLHDHGVIKYDYGVWRYAKSLDPKNLYETVNQIIKTIFPTGDYEEFLDKSPVVEKIEWSYTNSWFTANIICDEIVQRWIESYWKIKNYRNNANHAVNKALKTGDIKKEIENYLVISKILFSNNHELNIEAKDYSVMLYFFDLFPDPEKGTISKDIFKKLKDNTNDDNELNKQLQAFISEAEIIYDGSQQKTSCPIIKELSNKKFNKDWNYNSYFTESSKYAKGIKLIVTARDKNSSKVLVDVLKKRAKTKSFDVPSTYIFESILKLIQDKGDLILPLPDFSGDKLLDGLQEFLTEFNKVKAELDNNSLGDAESIKKFLSEAPILTAFSRRFNRFEPEKYFKETILCQNDNPSEILVKECCSNIKKLKQSIESVCSTR